jgi:heme-degrading monooxygenase HmoA
MFARVVSMQVKPNASGDFARVFENEMVPVLQRQRGFSGEVLLMEPGGPEAVVVSFWDSRQDAEVFAREGYPALMERLKRLVQRVPAVKTLQLAHSTIHASGIAAFPNQSPNTTPPGSPGA